MATEFYALIRSDIIPPGADTERVHAIPLDGNAALCQRPATNGWGGDGNATSIADVLSVVTCPTCLARMSQILRQP